MPGGDQGKFSIKQTKREFDRINRIKDRQGDPVDPCDPF
jgi:hypothetical protein